MHSETVYSVSWCSGILCHRVRESQDNPETASVTPAYQKTLSQGCWEVRESQDYPGTEGVTQVYRDTLPQGCWWARESQDNPGTAFVTLAYRDTGAGPQGLK